VPLGTMTITERRAERDRRRITERPRPYVARAHLILNVRLACQTECPARLEFDDRPQGHAPTRISTGSTRNVTGGASRRTRTTMTPIDRRQLAREGGESALDLGQGASRPAGDTSVALAPPDLCSSQILSGIILSLPDRYRACRKTRGHSPDSGGVAGKPRVEERHGANSPRLRETHANRHLAGVEYRLVLRDGPFACGDQGDFGGPPATGSSYRSGTTVLRNLYCDASARLAGPQCSIRGGLDCPFRRRVYAPSP
jgi:hypothetical protein